MADLAIITPTRDGMNTTRRVPSPWVQGLRSDFLCHEFDLSMEFVVCQGSENKSPVILSEFTGVTGSMRCAVKVNPWDFGVSRVEERNPFHGLSFLIAPLFPGSCQGDRLLSDYGRGGKGKKALGRSIAFLFHYKSKTSCVVSIRLQQLYNRVTSHTAEVWAGNLVLNLVKSMHSDHDIFTPYLEEQVLVNKFKQAAKRLLLFDYGKSLLSHLPPGDGVSDPSDSSTDGTLTPIVKEPSAAVPSEQLLKNLEILCADPRNTVYIISGRDGAFLDQHLGHLQNLGFSAEHGCFLRQPGTKEWRNLTQGLDMSWMNDVEERFRCTFVGPCFSQYAH